MPQTARRVQLDDMLHLYVPFEATSPLASMNTAQVKRLVYNDAYRAHTICHVGYGEGLGLWRSAS
jgi:hypothetical protein